LYHNIILQMGHLERKIREKENIKQSILNAALDIAIAEGWQAVTIRRISEKIEYTTSIVYGHFESKEALLREITDSGFRTLYQIFENTFSKKADPKKQLLQISLINWDFALNNKELYHLMFSMERPSNETASKGMTLIKGVFAKLSGKKEDEVDSLILNWICIRQGAINLMLDFKDDELDIKNPRKLYIEFIERFISSIT
jgi:AcrR family transcriptional regulator